MRRIALWLLVLLLPTLASCSRVAPEEELRDIVQSRVDAVFAEPLLSIASLRRVGSGPLSSEDGRARRVVYYNARLELLRDYALSDWQSINAASLASLLGAADRGITGIKADGNQAGDILEVRGSISFEDNDGWRPIGFVAPAVTDTSMQQQGDALADELIDRIEAVLSQPQASEPEARQVIANELDTAHRRIVRRLERLQRAFIIAGGPPQGEYQLVAETLARQITASGVTASAIPTDGSVENLRLLESGDADLIIVQSDIAAMAYQGQGVFSGQSPHDHLRAIASLFPEPLHIVVRADSPITSVAHLAGKRVDLGLPDSGTRASALAILAAYGLKEHHISSQPGRSIDEAARALENGEIDAFFAMISVPARQLQALSARGNVRFLSLHTEAIETLQNAQAAFVPLNLPIGTYPRQTAPVTTIAVAAMLVARTDTPASEVQLALTSLFDETDFLAAGSTAGALISPHNAMRGLTIPPHPDAQSLLVNGSKQRNP